LRAPLVTRSLLDQREYSYRARSLSGIFRLRTLLNARGKLDVLHMHFGPVANCFRFARALFHAPLIVSFHGYDFSTVPRKEGRDVYQHLFGTSDVVMANSGYTKGRLESLGCPPDKIVSLPVGLNPDEFAFRPRALRAGEPMRILTVARLVEIKGHEFVLHALARLRSRVAGLRYDIIGDGPVRKQLEQLRTQLQLGDIVRFHGALSEEDVRRMFALAHIFVLCSVNVDGDEEGQGLVLQEAQACGLPVIATRHGAFAEGIAPENDYWLVPQRDVDALTTKLQELIQTQTQWPAIGNAGRAFVEKRYDIRFLNRQLVGIYESAIREFER
jgi:colanic acid/amylovoran biosynthesis glycosyltransferase